MATKEQFQEIIDKLLDNGIEITLTRRNGKTVYDLNLQAKSHLHLYFDESGAEIHYEGRYDDKGLVDDYRDVLHVAKDYYNYRGFASGLWMNLFVKEGMLTKKVETKTTVSYI